MSFVRYTQIDMFPVLLRCDNLRGHSSAVILWQSHGIIAIEALFDLFSNQIIPIVFYGT